jgi:hypothetical protein
MAVFVESEVLSEDLAEKVQNLDTDTFKWYLTNSAPDSAADAAIADLPAEIAAGNGYAAGGPTVNLSTSRTGAQTTVSGDQVVIIATGGSIGPFRYLCLTNTSASRFLGHLDYGSSVTLLDTNTFTIPAGSIFTVN